MCRALYSVMERYTKQFPLTSKVLQQLVTTENSCVEIETHKRHLALFPYHVKNVSVSIREILDEIIGKYDVDYDGILLGYKNLKLLSNQGVTNYDSCYIHIDIQADFVLFKPAPGKELPAIVTKKSRDHVGCLVYHTFNVSLPKPEGIENWTGNDVEIGEEIIIRVTYAKLDAKLPYIKGEFLNNISEYTKIVYEKPVNKKLKFDEDTEEVMEPKHKKKKKQKNRNMAEENESFKVETEIDTSLSKKKKRKIENSLPEAPEVKKKKKIVLYEELDSSCDVESVSDSLKKKRKHSTILESEAVSFEMNSCSPKKKKKHSKTKEC